MRSIRLAVYGTAAVVAVGLSWSCSASQAGPLGGDVVPIEGGTVRAEVLASADTGEVVVRTWDSEADEPQPIAAKSLVVGQGEQQVELEPFPLETDPPGRCSRFYGQADWMRGGAFEAGWLRHGPSADGARHNFTCRRCWEAGREHAGAWETMATHHGQRMKEHGRPMGGPR